ncbi:MAG TPA: HAD family hydrolase [Chloroflexota bacterium]|nr:HAD family hydrolase [Chloroflexota bacterium]
MIEALILDYGHTIVDFALDEQALLATYEEARALLTAYAVAEVPSARTLVDQVSYRIGARIEDSYRHQDLEELDILKEFEQALGALDLHVPPDLVRRIAAMEHRALAAETFLPPENAEALRALRADGFRLGLVSNITLLGDLVREDLDHLGILDLFDATVLSSEERLRKPHPAIYATVLGRLGIVGSAAIFAGDRLREDIGGPQQAGMRAVLTRQFRQEVPDPATPQPDAIIERLAELPAVARTLREAR